jgi:hypothetical protein
MMQPSKELEAVQEPTEQEARRNSQAGTKRSKE